MEMHRSPRWFGLLSCVSCAIGLKTVTGSPVGKLNFWAARANLTVQILDIRPSLTTVMRQFERVRQRLEEEGVIRPERGRPLPRRPPDHRHPHQRSQFRSGGHVANRQGTLAHDATAVDPDPSSGCR